MTPERYKQIMQVVDQLLDRPEEERTAILDQFSNRDDSLRRDVEQLMGQQSSVTGFLEHSPLEALSHAEVDAMIGRRVGPYRLTEAIGRGGMGAVYKAVRDDDEYKTVVAIKLIKRGMDTDYILRRFRNERQILANLHHPNIAALLDGGTSEDGLPYFVMEYVEGEPIDDYCVVRNLSITEQLELFRTVCSAVQYAHQNLVVHRDLKPSNILITREGSPKLLDFGIAKLLQNDTDDSTALTATELRVMTPRYASPEQVKGQQITTASDVYSLGVVLYELLTGQRPYRFHSNTPDEVAQVICDQEPLKPSKAKSEALASASGSRARRADPPAHVDGSDKSLPPAYVPTSQDSGKSSDLRGDLDNIVLMALRKEPQRRYLSVQDFSEDIRRYLEHLPVHAHKDTRAYRAGKFIRRHRVGVAAAALIALTLIGGIIATAWQARVARAERAKAERRFNDVRRLANSFMFEFYDEIDKSPTKAKELVVKRALEYLDSLAQEAGGDTGLQRELANAYFRIGEVQGGYLGLGASVGDTKGSLDSHRKALALREKLITLEPNNPGLRFELAESYGRTGNLLLGALSKPQEAVEYYRKAVAIVEPLSAASPSDLKLLKALSGTYAAIALALGGGGPSASTGDAKLALEFYNKSIKISEAILAQNPSDIDERRTLGSTYSHLGNWMTSPTEALENYQKALAIDEALVAEHSKNVTFRREVAVQHSNIASVLLRMDEKARSLEHSRRALIIYEQLVAEDKNNAGALKDLAIGYRNVGKALAAMKDTKGAAEQYRKAIEIFEDLLKQDAANAYNRRQLAFTHLQVSILLSTSGDVSGAINQAERAIGHGEQLVTENAKNNTAQRTLADSYVQLGKCHTLLAAKSGTAAAKQKDHWRQARDWYQKALNIWQAMRDQGTLSNADANKPDEIAREIAKCDAALKS